jgi:hypothetical protein
VLQINATTGNGQILVLPDPRLVTFKVTGDGSVSAGQVTIEGSPKMLVVGKDDVPGQNDVSTVWTPITTIAVPANATTEYFAGIQFGTLRARISTPVTGGTVTVLAIRPEEQKGWSRRPS